MMGFCQGSCKCQTNSGTERHESRRIDNQLRGRSGRQGDPGSSVFFVSFEDSLMRLLLLKLGKVEQLPLPPIWRVGVLTLN
jgi:hypothetical protein